LNLRNTGGGRLEDPGSNGIKSLKSLVAGGKLPSNVSVEKKAIRRWRINIALIIIGILMILYGYQNIHYYEHYKSWKEEFTVLPKDAQPWYWRLSEGSILEINATIQGGNGDVIIYVVDESGRRIEDFGKLVSPVSIRFLAPASGNYTVYFDNTFSTLVPKKIHAVASVYTKEFRFWSFELVIVGISLVVLGISNSVLGNTRGLALRIGNDTYEFEPWWGSLKIKVNGIEAKERIGKRAVFRVGPNDEYVLEIRRKFSAIWWVKWRFILDGNEIGEVP